MLKKLGAMKVVPAGGEDKSVCEDKAKNAEISCDGLPREPLFSICLPAYEDAGAVERALSCLFQQSVTDWECLVSDDSPTDAVASRVAAYADPRIRYRRNTPSLGVPANWNTLLEEAGGRYVTLLHQDDFYQRGDVLERVAATFASEGCDVVVCACRHWAGGQADGRPAGGERHLKAFLHDFPGRSLVVNRIGHPSVLFLRKEKGIPLFDERLRYFLDTDWYARLFRQGGRACFLPEPWVDVESGRAYQLSRTCVAGFAQTAGELAYALDKHGATAAEAAQACARLYASHVRHWGRGWLAALRGTLRHLSWRQRCVFFLFLLGCLGHMGYRGLRKLLGFSAWR